MSGASGAVLAIVVAVLAGMVVSLVTGILAWIRDSKPPTRKRAANAILQGGAAWASTILPILAMFTAMGVLR